MAVHTSSTETESRESGAAPGMGSVYFLLCDRFGRVRLGPKCRVEGVAVALRHLSDGPVEDRVLAAGEARVLHAEGVSLGYDLDPHPAARDEERGEKAGQREDREREDPRGGDV